MNRNRSDDLSLSSNPIGTAPAAAHSTVRSATGAREAFLSYPRIESFRSFDFDVQTLSSTTNEETETTCRNCSYICTTRICPVCGTYNAPHHERAVVSSRDGEGLNDDKTRGNTLKLPLSLPPPPLGIDSSKRKNKKSSKSRSRSRKLRENPESSSSYVALPDLGDDDVVKHVGMAHPASPITPAPRRRSMHRDEHGILSTTPMRRQIRILANTKSESDLPRTPPADCSGWSTRTMDAEYPLRASLSPIRRGFRDRNDMQRAIVNGGDTARASPREERGLDGTRLTSTTSGSSSSSIQQISECRTSIPVPSDKSLPTHQPEEITIDNAAPPASPNYLTAWSDEELNKPWECKTCTFVNENPMHLSCSMCGVLREIGRQARPSPSAFEEQMAFLRGETQQSTIQSKSKKLEEEWFVKLREQRMEELFQLQTEYLRKVCGGV